MRQALARLIRRTANRLDPAGAFTIQVEINADIVREAVANELESIAANIRQTLPDAPAEQVKGAA